MDVLLSSGFLAFARHLGFLDALRQQDIQPDAIVGTSSGAMVGALHLAGLSADDIATTVASRAPLRDIRPSLTPWRGLFSLKKVQDKLSEVLPERFEDLPLPFAVGVVDAQGHRLITSGPLVPAVIASCAMPRVFTAIQVGDAVCYDGGAVDRLAVEPWRKWRPNQEGIAHWVQRTAGQDVDVDLTGLTIVQTPRSGAKLWSLGDFQGQREEASACTRTALQDL